MTIGAQADQVLKSVLFDLTPRDNMRLFQRAGHATNSSAVPALDHYVPSNVYWYGWPAGHILILLWAVVRAVPAIHSMTRAHWVI